MSRSSHSRSIWAWARSSSAAVGPSAAKRASSSSTAASICSMVASPEVLTSSQPRLGAAGEAEQAEAGGDGGAVAAHEAVVEAAGLAAAEDGEGQVGRVGLAGAVVREPVGGHQGAGRDVLVDVLADLPAEGVGQGAVARGLLAVVAGDGAEVLLHPGDGLLGVDVADDGEDGVVRRVVRAEERAGVLQGGGVEVGHGADGGVVVRVAVGEGERGELLEGGAVGHVVVALAALVLDDVALVLHGRVVQGGEQRAHPVGLQPEGELQLVGGHGLEVVGALEAGGAVERAAGCPARARSGRCSRRWRSPGT